MMQKEGRYRNIIAVLYIMEDLVLLNLLYFVMMHAFEQPFSYVYHVVLILGNLGYLLSFAVVHVDFSDVKQLHIPHLLRRNFYKLAITALILIASLFFLKIAHSASRLFIGSFFTSACLLMTAAQWVTRKALTFTIRKTISKGIILGAGLVGIKVFEEMLRNVYNGIVILGFFDDNPAQNNSDISGNIEEAKEYILRNGVTSVFCTLPPAAEEKIRDFIKFCESHVISFHIVPGIGYYHTGAQPVVEHIGKMPVFVLRNIPLSYIHHAFTKRVFDIFVSLMVIIVFFPVLFPVLGILIRLSSPGPVLFKQRRTGRQGKEFTCYKFRTMRCSADAHVKQATANDNRKTGIGDFLRKSSLDEFPQFFNVLIGNMSLVGPRPHMLMHTYEYSPKVDKYMVRHFIKPGITGLAQVRGFRGETRNIELMENRIRADIEYVENWTFGLDIKILFQTVFNVMKGDKRAY